MYKDVGPLWQCVIFSGGGNAADVEDSDEPEFCITKRLCYRGKSYLWTSSTRFVRRDVLDTKNSLYMSRLAGQ